MDEERVNRVRKERKTIRSLTTKLINKVKECLDETSDGVDDRKLRQFQTALEEKSERLKELDSEILNCLYTTDSEDNICENEAEQAQEIQENIIYQLICVKDALKEVQDENSSIHLRSRTLSASKESVVSVASNDDCKSIVSTSSSLTNLALGERNVRVKLPKLQMRNFSGKVQDWQEFWDSFKSAIDDDPGLAKIDKFKYLRSFLDEPARRVISGLSLTDAEYDSAVEILKKRFAKPSLIKRAHINDLMNLNPVFNDRNIGRLRHLLDDIETHFRGLEALGVDKETYSSIVVPVLMDKLPENIRINMIRFGGDYLNWGLDEMMEALAREVEIRESHVSVFRPHVSQSSAAPRPTPSQHQREKIGTASTLFTQQPVGKRCPFCYESHAAEDCNNVKGPDERKCMLSRYARCFLCLSKGHKAFQCRSKIVCKYCKEKHHFLICSSNRCKSPSIGRPSVGANKEAQQQASASASAPTLNPGAEVWVGSTGSFCPNSGERVALQTALARVEGSEKSKVRVLYDSGSQKTFISAKVVDKLDLKPLREEELGIKTFGKSEPELKKRAVYEVALAPLHGHGRSVVVEAFIVDEISTISNIHVEKVKLDYEHLSNIYFSDVSKFDVLEIDILIGSNHLWNFQEGQVIRGGLKEPVAVKTALGWVLSGPVAVGKSDISDFSLVSLVIEPTPLSHKEIVDVNKSVHKLWDLETVGIRIDNEVHQKAIDDISFNGERYSVGLPWKVGHDPVPDNYSKALVRLKSQLRKLSKSPEVLDQYDKIIKEQLELGIVDKVSEEGSASKVSYLPHQPVIREDAETTKVRIVYDASCKDRTTKTSLNDCLHVGPSLTPLMVDILLRFREQPVVLVGDIEKAFLNIEVHEGDRDCLRFLWVKDVHAKDTEIVVYRFNRVVFGVNSSPFLLNAVLRHHIKQHEDIDPEFVDCLTNAFFVDDLVTSCKDAKAGYSLYVKASERLRRGGFKLRKWKTNDKTLSRRIQETENATDSKSTPLEFEDIREKLIVSEIKKSKVLGLEWDIEKDLLEYNLGKIGEDAKLHVPTKRGILSTLASLYDPLGIISPVAVPAKILFQDLCIDKSNWDSPLAPDKAIKWEKWIESLSQASVISAPRCISPETKGKVTRTSIHGFGDASKKAYCAAIYLIIETTEGISSRLLCSKTRIAPLKGLSIPRLELMAAKILTTLMQTVVNALSKQTEISEIRYWSDSMTVLYWLQNRGEWKTFVQHRINEILKVSNKNQWGHVAGLENPADLGSRGVLATELKNDTLWWRGPQWLTSGVESWPNISFVKESMEVSEERKKDVIVMTVTEEPAG